MTAKQEQQRKPSEVNSDKESPYKSGEPGFIGERFEEARGNVYPASGPLPHSDAKVQPMGTFGQGERGAAGYEDSGASEIIPPQSFLDEEENEDHSAHEERPQKPSPENKK